MSWYVSIVKNAVFEDEEDVIWERNLTYNNYDILEKSLGLPEGLRSLHLAYVSNYFEIIRDALQDLKENRKDYLELEPSNKWGGIDDCIEFFEGMLNAVKGRDDRLIIIVN